MNLNKYLIGIEDLELRESQIVIVLADSKENAIEKYIANISIKDKTFLDDVYCPCINMSYAEHLFIDDNGDYLYDEYGNPRYSYEERQHFFKNNVADLFENNKDWYNLYLSIFENENDENIIFPNEMLIHMYKNDKSYSDELFCKELGVEILELV